MKTPLLKYALVLFIVLFAQCTFTSTKSFEPKFRDGMEAIEPQLTALITCKHINVAGIQQTVNDKTERAMEIAVLNAEDLPKNDERLRRLAGQVAVIFRDHLVNRGEFDIYRISFVEQSGEGDVKTKQLQNRYFYLR